MISKTREQPIDEDLAICESEKLAWTGMIQDHGALIVTDLEDEVLGYSANLSDYFDLPTNIDATLTIGDMFRENRDELAHRKKAIFERTHYLIADVYTNRGINGDLVLSHHAGKHYYEFELDADVTVPSYMHLAELPVKALEHDYEIDLIEFLRSIYRLTGYPKIMVYQFLEDEAGEVIAELNASGLDNYLGLRFPASDVPRIARDLYALNPYRLIYDIDADMIAMKTVPGMEDSVDLTTASLRSVSPVHLEYLTNMQVRSSASFSVRVKGKLWGLLALHATAPTTIPVKSRAKVRELVNDFESALLNRQVLDEHNRLNATARMMGDLAKILVDCSEESCPQVTPPADIEEMINADNLLIMAHGRVVYQSKTVKPEHLHALSTLGRERAVLGQFAADSLQHHLDQDEAFRQQTSGLLYASTGKEGEALPRIELLWLREEDASHVHWAGEPTKIRREVNGQVRISPRQSFEKWSQVAQGQAIPWSATDKLLANKMLQMLIGQLSQRATY